MLVLTRKLGERIQIGDDISVLIMEIKGRQVKIGIDAPSFVKVHREEIYNKIQEENIDASNIEPEELNKINSLFNFKKD